MLAGAPDTCIRAASSWLSSLKSSVLCDREEVRRRACFVVGVGGLSLLWPFLPELPVTFRTIVRISPGLAAACFLDPCDDELVVVPARLE